MNIQWSKFSSLFTDAFRRFQSDEGSRFGASIAYYSVFSLVPLLVIVITVAGFFLGASNAEEQILGEAGTYLGEEGKTFIEQAVRAVQTERLGPGLTLLSILLVLAGAIAVFKELKDALNRVFDAPKARGGILGFLRKNLLLFGLVLAMGFLLLVSLVLSAVLSLAARYFSELFSVPPLLWQSLNFLLSFLVTGGLFALLYRLLPDKRLPWQHILFGSLVTALLFTVGKSVIGFYLGHSDPASAFGAAGTLVLILLWTYYSAQIVLFGAELTAVHATRQGYLAYRAETPASASTQNSKKKDFLARVTSLVILFFLRRVIKRFFRKA